MQGGRLDPVNPNFAFDWLPAKRKVLINKLEKCFYASAGQQATNVVYNGAMEEPTFCLRAQDR